MLLNLFTGTTIEKTPKQCSMSYYKKHYNQLINNSELFYQPDRDKKYQIACDFPMPAPFGAVLAMHPLCHQGRMLLQHKQDRYLQATQQNS